MKKLFTIISTASLALTMLASPMIASAVVCPTTGAEITGDTPCPLPDDYSGPGDFIDTLDRITGWLFTFLLIFAVIMFIWAAYLYLFSGGAEESTAKAKNYLIYGVIGIAVAMLSKGITFIVYQLL